MSAIPAIPALRAPYREATSLSIEIGAVCVMQSWQGCPRRPALLICSKTVVVDQAELPRCFVMFFLARLKCFVVCYST